MGTHLKQLAEDIFNISDHVNYGLIRTGSKCIIIDTGLDDESGRRILESAKSLNLTIAAIINTHSHADHYGGNNYLVRETGCSVYAPAVEAAIMENPELESIYIFGANPPAELQTRFLKGKRSSIDAIVEQGTTKILDKEVTIESLPGHSPNHIGISVDGICFCGDTIFAREAWEKFVLVYGFNIGKMKASIENLKKIEAKAYVPSHISVMEDIEEIATYNIDRIDEVIGAIKDILKKPSDVATILEQICRTKEIQILNMQQYYLSLDTLKAYLSYLAETGYIKSIIRDSKLLWITES